MPLKRIFIAFLFIITASHVFSFPFIMDISDWEKRIKALDCVESVEYELSAPYDDDCHEYNMKIYLTGNRYLQIRYFEPYYTERHYPSTFHIVRIGNIVPIALYYRIEETLYKIEKTKYDLYFKSFSFNYLYPYIEGKKGKKGIIDLIKNYDKYLDMLNQLPSYSEIFPKDEVIDIDDGDNSASEIWNKYSSPYIHKDHYKNEYWEYWEEYKIYKMTVEEYNYYASLCNKNYKYWQMEIFEENP